MISRDESYALQIPHRIAVLPVSLRLSEQPS
jgi:hypothetical protein